MTGINLFERALLVAIAAINQSEYQEHQQTYEPFLPVNWKMGCVRVPPCLTVKGVPLLNCLIQGPKRAVDCGYHRPPRFPDGLGVPPSFLEPLPHNRPWYAVLKSTVKCTIRLVLALFSCAYRDSGRQDRWRA